MELNSGGFIAAAALLVAVLTPIVLRRLRGAAQNARSKVEARESLREKAEGKPPLTAADVEDLKQWLEAEKLPYAALAPEAEPPASPVASRLGGPAFLPESVDWPSGADGKAHIFLAQINFAEMPRLPDYPESGLLSVFVADDDVWGANFDDGERGDFVVMYFPDVTAPGRLVSRPGGAAATSPFMIADVESRGRALRFGDTGATPPSGSDWRIEARWPAWWTRKGDERFVKMLEPDDASRGSFAYVGGQPRFTQSDPRGEGNPFDRVLLQVGSDDNVMWGDVGEAVFMIRRQDLLSRNFSRVLFSWDCH